MRCASAASSLIKKADTPDAAVTALVPRADRVGYKVRRLCAPHSIPVPWAGCADSGHGEGAPRLHTVRVTILYIVEAHSDCSHSLLQEVYEQVPAAKALFDRASEVLDYDLLQACVEGAAPVLSAPAAKVCHLGMRPSSFMLMSCLAQGRRTGWTPQLSASLPFTSPAWQPSRSSGPRRATCACIPLDARRMDQTSAASSASNAEHDLLNRCRAGRSGGGGRRLRPELGRVHGPGVCRRIQVPS